MSDWSSDVCSSDLLRAFLTHLPAPAILKDRDGRVLIANEAGAQVYGVTTEALTGRTFAEVLPAPIAEHIEARERALVERGESGSAPCRGSVWKAGEVWVVAGALKKRKE